MKIISLLSIAGLFLIKLGEAKPRYSLINDKAILEFYNTTAGKDVTFGMKQMNSVQFSLTTSFTTLYEFGDGVSVDAKIYALKGDQYKIIPFNVKSNVCKIWKTNMMGFASLQNFGNITGCGIAKFTNYYITDYIPEIDKFPPVLPLGSYMLDISFWKDDWKLFVLKWYSRILPPSDDL